MKGVKTLMISDLALLIGSFSSDDVVSMAVKGLRWLSRLRENAPALCCPCSLPRDGLASTVVYDTQCTIHAVRYTMLDKEAPRLQPNEQQCV